MSARLMFLLIGLCLSLNGGLSVIRADERLFGIACRSVHLQYPSPGAIAFYNEITVQESAPGTYFCVCGFRRGYFGIQELSDGKKVVIFSVWDDYRGDDPNAVPEERRVQTLYQGEGVRIGRFGNEGTGGQSFLDFDWQVDETYHCMITAELQDERTAYTAWFYMPESELWFRMATFSTIASEYGVRGLYSFVEDFRRDRVSATQRRSAEFGNGWIQSSDGQWIALTRARFTADSNPATNIDGGILGDRFYLQTGGETENVGARLDEFMDRPPTGVPQLPLPVSLPETENNSDQ